MGLLNWKDITTTWSNLTQTWSLVEEIIEVVDGSFSYAHREKRQNRYKHVRQNRLNEYIKKEPEKSKKVVYLICRVKGEKVYDEKKLTEGNIKISINDIDMLEDIMKRKMEIANVI